MLSEEQIEKLKKADCFYLGPKTENDKPVMFFHTIKGVGIDVNTGNFFLTDGQNKRVYYDNAEDLRAAICYIANRFNKIADILFAEQEFRFGPDGKVLGTPDARDRICNAEPITEEEEDDDALSTPRNTVGRKSPMAALTNGSLTMNQVACKELLQHDVSEYKCCKFVKLDDGDILIKLYTNIGDGKDVHMLRVDSSSRIIIAAKPELDELFGATTKTLHYNIRKWKSGEGVIISSTPNEKDEKNESAT